MLRRILDSPWLYFGLAGLLAVLALLSQFELYVPSRSQGGLEELRALRQRDDLNVVFFLVDTLRADRLGAYGYERDTSPVLDGLAAAGVRFAQTESQSSWTKTSMASLWTGLTPTRTGITRYNHVLPPAATLVAERFQEAGYLTGAIWRNGWVAPNFGFSQGFDSYTRPVPSRDPERLSRRTLGKSRLPGSDQDATEAAVEFMRANAHQRFFLYVHYMDIHQYTYDHAASSLGFGTSYSDAYDMAIHWTDRNIGEVLKTLEELGLFERSVVVVASDHGEEFYEHGAEYHARHLYREVTTVPFVILPPFLLDPGVVVETPVRNLDVWPTVLDLVGLPPLPGADGRSQVPRIEAALGGNGARPAEPDASISYLDKTWGNSDKEPNPMVALKDGSWRLIYQTLEPGSDELYDRSQDPWEQRNLAAEEPERVVDLRSQAEALLAAEVPWGEVPEVELDALRLEQLRALGYAVGGGQEEEKPEKPKP